MARGTILSMTNLTIRSATAADAAALAHLAALDSSEIPAGPVFLAEQDEHLIAAVSAPAGAAPPPPPTPPADPPSPTPPPRRPAAAAPPRRRAQRAAARAARPRRHFALRAASV